MFISIGNQKVAASQVVSTRVVRRTHYGEDHDFVQYSLVVALTNGKELVDSYYTNAKEAVAAEKALQTAVIKALGK